MRALEIREHGGPEVLVPVDIAEPTPGPGQLLVRLEAAGVNYIDTYFRTGLYKRELPYVPGDEGSGVVESVGDGVGEFVVGQRVAWATAPGSYAEKVIVPASAAVAVPDGVPAEQAASALLQGMTAHYLLKSTYPAAAGDTVLVHAGAGGVGLILTQLAVAAGVRVITTVSTDAKAELSRQAGASEVLKYTDDVPARVRELTDGEGAHAVYDGVGARRSSRVSPRYGSAGRSHCSAPPAVRYRRSTRSGSTERGHCFSLGRRWLITFVIDVSSSGVRARCSRRSPTEF